MKPNFKLHPNENPSIAIIRLYKHVRSIYASYKPQSHYAAKKQYIKAMKPKLYLVK